MIKNEKGIVLIVVLLITALLVAMVVEFAYNVYTTTSASYNYKDRQNLSFLAKSGINIAASFISNISTDYTYPGKIVYSTDKLDKDFEGDVTIEVEDENAKFNVNTIAYDNGLVNKDKYEMFKRLLSSLSLDEDLANRILDWIDKDKEPHLTDSESGAKNAPLYSVDELLMIPEFPKSAYKKLSPYITVYSNGLININSAEKPVLMCLSEDITEDLAQRIISYREITPFKEKSDILKVAGFETIGISIMGRITVKGKEFDIISTASKGGIKSIIQCVLNDSGKIDYWKEF